MPDINVNKLSEALNTKADIDLNNTGVFSTSEGGVVNLTSSTPADASGKEVTSAEFIKSDIQSNLMNYTTNRILEIPQDIKLELNNGTLTLKAGSKVYVPNGFEADGTTPKFDEVVISSDLTNTTTANTQLAVTVYYNKLAPFLLSKCFSGGTAPTSPTVGTLWYDTASNKMKVYANSIWNERNDCFPIAMLTANGSSYSSIDQIFNGFGYIGSTVFALPGVKVQIPDGRNPDGTCKSVLYTQQNVGVNTFAWGSSYTGKYPLLLRQSSATIESTSFNYYFVSNTTQLPSNDCYFYDSKTNLTGGTQSGSIYYFMNVYVGTMTLEAGVLKGVNVETVNSLLNSNLSNLSAAGEAKLKSNIRLVNELPANPEPGVLYCIPEA